MHTALTQRSRLVSFRSVSLAIGMLGASALFTGCAANFSESAQSAGTAMSLSGQVHGGQSPITGSKVYLYAAGTGGYGTAARSMLSGSGYVTTGAGGGFTITGDYTCQTGDQVYLLSLGGNPGLTPSTVNNSAIALIAALGPCSSLTPSTNIIVDEATTVAAVYALAPYMTSSSAVASNSTALSIKGLTNAFLSAANLASYATGQANANTVGQNGVVPQAEINTLANALATCVNSDGTGSPCASLFAAAKPTGGTTPTDTVQAALNIALSPGSNVSTLYGLVQANGPFQPTLTAAPHDWSVAITYTGGGLSGGDAVAVDGLGNIWVLGQFISAFDPTGTPLSPPIGFQSGLTAYSLTTGLALDSSNNAWIGVYENNPNLSTTNPHLIKLNNAGTLLSPLAGYTGGGVGTYSIDAMAFDSAGNLWTEGGNLSGSGGARGLEVQLYRRSALACGRIPRPTPLNDNTLSDGPAMFGDASGNIWVGDDKFSSTGAVLATSSPCGPSLDETAAIDHNGNIWSASGGSGLYECNSSGAQLNTSAGYPSNVDDAEAVQIDGTNRVWSMSENSYTAVGVMSTAAVVASPDGGYQNPSIGNGSDHFAIDGSGSVWVAVDGPYLVQYVGLASPVVTPLATALSTNSLGVRP